jgi:hypothetical protein
MSLVQTIVRITIVTGFSWSPSSFGPVPGKHLELPWSYQLIYSLNWWHNCSINDKFFCWYILVCIKFIRYILIGVQHYCVCNYRHKKGCCLQVALVCLWFLRMFSNGSSFWLYLLSSGQDLNTDFVCWWWCFTCCYPYTKSGAGGTVQMSGWLQCWCCWWRDTEELQVAWPLTTQCSWKSVSCLIHY